ncbi:hypothetical protein PQX77_004022 [Marasmius sp. AFHP31]|nr:hypothetical protein PQX77_004022 [Marasmius sp. AFHP31]
MLQPRGCPCFGDCEACTPLKALQLTLLLAPSRTQTIYEIYYRHRQNRWKIFFSSILLLLHV